ncbi:hypothetical protein PMAYCL1PPCAC_17190, partial [Pristionchus mayeri]
MQRRFFRTQIAQMLLPIVLSSIPIGVVCVASFIGKDMTSLPFLLGFILWPLPAISALLLLAFVWKTTVNRKTTLTKV